MSPLFAHHFGHPRRVILQSIGSHHLGVPRLIQFPEAIEDLELALVTILRAKPPVGQARAVFVSNHVIDLVGSYTEALFLREPLEH